MRCDGKTCLTKLKLSHAVSSTGVESLLAGRVLVLVGDITAQDVTAIVNAANSTLFGGGGVDGAIHRAGGPRILEECKQIRKTVYPDGLPTGHAVITTGGNLTAKHVIHTVGPVYGREPERQSKLLADCYQNSLLLARQHAADAARGLGRHRYALAGLTSASGCPGAGTPVRVGEASLTVL